MPNQKESFPPKGVDKIHKILIFRPYPLKAGEKILIDSGPRKGDWEVLEVGERKVKLRCPISLREKEWDRFCYFVEEKNDLWPNPD